MVARVGVCGWGLTQTRDKSGLALIDSHVARLMSRGLQGTHRNFVKPAYATMRVVSHCARRLLQGPNTESLAGSDRVVVELHANRRLG